MHPIASWMHAVDLYDEVEVTPAARDELAVEWAPLVMRETPIDWPAEKDLAWRALRCLERDTGRALTSRIAIQKRIPVGGGLGGGSSDGAAALLAANEAFDLKLSLDRLAWVSRELGSDVAYFLDGEIPPRPAVVAGLGDRVARVARIKGWAVLIVPPFGCPTGPVYKAYDGLGPRPLREGDVAHIAAAGRIAGGLLFNDLWDAAQAVRPELADVRERLRRAAPGPVCLSGSGSTLFIPAPDFQEAARLERLVRSSLPSAGVRAVRLV